MTVSRQKRSAVWNSIFFITRSWDRQIFLGLNGFTLQPDLFSPARDNTTLMQVMDRINTQWGRGTLHSAAEGVTKAWRMKREQKSPGYTTDWNQIPVVC